MIGGYFLSILNNFDLCSVVYNVKDELCTFVLTIILSIEILKTKETKPFFSLVCHASEFHVIKMCFSKKTIY
jgi:hypothetical protein